MKKELIKLANHLDRIDLVKEANYVDGLIIKIASPAKTAGPDEYKMPEEDSYEGELSSISNEERISNLEEKVKDLEEWKFKHSPYNQKNPHHTHFSR